jgi:hypothetical protein
MTAESIRSGTPGRNNLVIQRDFHGRLVLCDHIRNTMITAEDWIAHERYRVGQDIQPRHCEDYDMLTQIIDEVFHLQQESFDSWMNNKTDRIPVNATLEAMIVKTSNDSTGGEVSQLNTPQSLTNICGYGYSKTEAIFTRPLSATNTITSFISSSN